ncbi:MAG TPA: NAD(P)-dependent oxidoreductase [Actinomycetota bacterium]|nr:NAD(P)-dependent oxidoreductase [Actinomycetota bacterium]
MRVLVAGGTGAIGRRLVPELVHGGHEVTVLGRSSERLRAAARAGADAVECDVLDSDAVVRAVGDAAPDAIVNVLTRLPERLKPRRLADVYARNDEVRRVGGDNLLRAARASGVARVVVQSAAYWYAPGAPGPRTEDDPFFVDAPEPIGTAVRTMQAAERAALQSGLEVVILRYGMFYGPGTWYSADGDVGRQVRARAFPLVGSGDGVFSFVHVDDAARATALAVTGPAGVYNVVDDDPARVAEWLPAFADALGARPPRRVPVWLARIAAGDAMVTWMQQVPGADNQRAREQLGWTPRYASWRDGFRRGLADPEPATPRDRTHAGDGR